MAWQSGNAVLPHPWVQHPQDGSATLASGQLPRQVVGLEQLPAQLLSPDLCPPACRGGPAPGLDCPFCGPAHPRPAPPITSPFGLSSKEPMALWSYFTFVGLCVSFLSAPASQSPEPLRSPHGTSAQDRGQLCGAQPVCVEGMCLKMNFSHTWKDLGVFSLLLEYAVLQIQVLMGSV